MTDLDRGKGGNDDRDGEVDGMEVGRTMMQRD